MKLCVFQGTFNPIHSAHLAMANYIKRTYDFDSVLFIPAYKPPHKELDYDLADHRFKMVKIAIEGENFFNISNIEFQNERFSYTYLTILELYKRYKIDGKINFIIGMDAFREVSDWYEADKLKKLVHFIVFARDTEMDKDRLVLLKSKGFEFSIAGMHFIELSSSDVRGKIAKGQSIGGLVPSGVAEYIKANELYNEEE